MSKDFIEENSNVIKLNFSKVKMAESESEYNSHLESLVSEELIQEFNEQEDTVSTPLFEDYKRVSYHQSLTSMSEDILTQLKELKTKGQRLKYYLDELNLDS